ncbi:MAG TPA: AAA family ATPase [Candidatus Binataceae bacterium]|nr:AAA family ATPase [Candidatus Binataceae bacterium]
MRATSPGDRAFDRVRPHDYPAEGSKHPDSARKPIILIGGTAGTGKTTLAGELSWRLRLDHRIGTGFIREIVKSQYRPEDCPELHGFTFRAEQPVANIREQAARLRPAVLACIDRARREGTSLIVEGTHLLPSLYHDTAVDLFAVLAAPDPEEHRRRLRGPSHLHRKTSERDFANIRLIDHYLASEAANRGIRYQQYEDSVEMFVQAMRLTSAATPSK